jgi:hypothetical protein
MSSYENIENIKMSEEWKSKIGIICRQTSYTEDEALSYLEEHKGDVEKVLCSYVDAPSQDSSKDKNIISSSVNQEIFKQIRTVMDDASRNYRKAKGLEEMELKRQEQQKSDKLQKEEDHPHEKMD